MKKNKMIGMVCFLSIMLTLIGCGKSVTNNSTEKITNIQTTVPSTELPENVESDEVTTESQSIEQEKEDIMKLYIDGEEIPVIWEENETIKELMEDAKEGDIVVNMSMYSNNEQVGSLGKRYSSNDKQLTTTNGDIVLYSSSNIVVFYAPNTWSYTRLGKMELSAKEVTELLSNGDVELIIKVN